MLLRPFPSCVRKMPLGTICVVREGFNSSPFLHHTIKSTTSAPAPECQPEQWRLNTLNVGMKQVCLFLRITVIADNGEGDQWSVAFEAVTNRDQHYS